MKKIMMLFMVSVFFLMGGMSDGTAQKRENGIAGKSINFPEYIHARPGETVRMYFQLSSEHSNWNAIGLCFQRLGNGLKPLVVLFRNGNVLYPPDMDHRLSISFDSSRSLVTVTLSNVKAEDEGIYYFAVRIDSVWSFWSGGIYLTIINPQPFVKN